ncbi:MAG: metal-dependent hydrolase [Phycisphaerales bacterium]|nr:metal-dependent hydrolase [Phycisphaerae bacterium]NNF43276.1 metal-dependent hydrolase [Phycisphaerales bacterium]NNM26653.1 metal-dependent hydrolase [Phycisphaerales bacterium]
MSVTLTFLGHAGFLVEDGGTKIAIDPFLTGNPVATMEASAVRCDAIVVTHGHADHFGDTVAIAKANDATVFGAFELCEYCSEMGVAKTEPMNPGGQVATDFGMVALTQAFHSSSYEGRYLGMPCGVVVRLGGVTIYHLGDTGLFSDLKLIGEIYQPDIAMIPIGDRFTMGPELAARAAQLVAPKVAIPVHYGTWPPIEQDAEAWQPEGVEVRVMGAGEQWDWGST